MGLNAKMTQKTPDASDCGLGKNQVVFFIPNFLILESKVDLLTPAFCEALVTFHLFSSSR
jgi:hypothetical protein